MMEWGASQILALRKHGGMTQAQFAQWLGVTIKQVKYLEHQRRNPSGPTRRLLGILADQLGFGSAMPVQVLGASPAELKSPARDLRREKAPSKPQDDRTALVVPAPAQPAATHATETEVSVPVPDDDAFVWR
jgi:transcriptional regulator with XRE-family HTH domain